MIPILRIDPQSVVEAAGKVTKPVLNPGPLFTALAADLERALRANFRAGGLPNPWPLSQRVQEKGGLTLMDRAVLVNSLHRRHTNEEATVYTRDRRAAIHHFGGTILPVHAKALTIPLSDRARGHRAGSFDKKKTFLLKRAGKDPVIMLKTENGIEALYVLKKSVTIPARPFMWPAPYFLKRMEQRVAEHMKKVR